MSPSPIRCRGPWKIHKRSSEPDRWLDEMGFFRKHTARDSSCLFRAVSENIFNTQRYFHKVRLDCVEFMASQRHLFEGSLTCPFENYLKEMSNPSEWGGLIEISAMSHLYRRDFVVFEANKGPQTKICNGYGDTIFLFYSPDTKHFDVVYTKEFINTSSYCQCNITRKQGLSKARKKEEPKSPEKAPKSPKLQWKEEKGTPETEIAQFESDINFTTYQHLDFINFEPLPVEVDALPLMVDCRQGAAAAHELAHAHAPHPTHAAHAAHAPHAAHPANGDHAPQAAGDMGAHALSSPGGAPAPGRIATPNNTPITTYSGVPMNVNPPYGYGACGVKSLVWCASPPPPPPPPPPVNPHVNKSVQPNGADLPMNDIPTLRYYFNLGVECMWAAYGPPPRHYSPRDLAQDMQQISLQDRGPPNGAHDHGKHKPGDKPPPNKGNGQRPLLGPRFKRGGNQDGGGPNNHAGKPHNNNNSNNNMNNSKGQNNRRNSHPEPRGAPAPAGYDEEPALLPLPYMPYPPPLYPLPYYPVDEPGMLGMMGGMGYVSYEEGAEFAPPLQPYYPQPYPPCQPCPPCPPCPPPLLHPHHPPPHIHPHHMEHK